MTYKEPTCTMEFKVELTKEEVLKLYENVGKVGLTPEYLVDCFLKDTAESKNRFFGDGIKGAYVYLHKMELTEHYHYTTLLEYCLNDPVEYDLLSDALDELDNRYNDDETKKENLDLRNGVYKNYKNSLGLYNEPQSLATGLKEFRAFKESKARALDQFPKPEPKRQTAHSLSDEYDW